jgi:hypothetical protein
MHQRKDYGLETNPVSAGTNYRVSEHTHSILLMSIDCLIHQSESLEAENCCERI